jgi:hypothetical protein
MIFVNREFSQLKQKGTVLHHEIGPNPPILLVKIKGSEGVYFEELIPPNEIGSNHVDLKERVRCRREGERENFKWKLQGQRKQDHALLVHLYFVHSRFVHALQWIQELPSPRKVRGRGQEYKTHRRE